MKCIMLYQLASALEVTPYEFHGGCPAVLIASIDFDLRRSCHSCVI